MTRAFIQKTMAVAAFVAVGAVGTTQAWGATGFDWALVDGSGTGALTFSEDARSALNASGAVVGAFEFNAAGLPRFVHGVVSESQPTVDLAFSSATTDGDRLTSLASNQPTGLLLSRAAVVDQNDNGTLISQHNVVLSHVKVDLLASTISADVDAYQRSYLFNQDNVAPFALVQSFKNVTIFQAAEVGVVTGGTQGNIQVLSASVTGVEALASGSLSGKLSLTSQALDTLLPSLGLSTSPDGTVFGLYKNADWGVATVSARFAPAPLPEPSTWALMGAGLAAIAAATRRRQAA